MTIFIVFALAFLRLVPHLPNFAPITAMALFSGVYLNRRYAFLVPLGALLLSDYLLLYINPFSAHPFNFEHIQPLSVLFYSSMWAVYGSFALSAVVGLWLKNHKSAGNVILATALCAVQFFLITNAAVWLGGMYDRSLLGLWESYVAGIPFFRGTLLGDFFYTGALFGMYELASNYIRNRTTALAH